MPTCKTSPTRPDCGKPGISYSNDTSNITHLFEERVTQQCIYRRSAVKKTPTLIVNNIIISLYTCISFLR